MTPIDREAIESATAAALLATRRLLDCLLHLDALVAGDLVAEAVVPVAAAVPAKLPRKPTGAGHPPRRYDFNGEQLTAKELAERAGCSLIAMRERLRKKTAADAVAMGAAPPLGQASNLLKDGRPSKRHALGGEMLTAAQLAKLAGCTEQAMWKRLRCGYSAAEAVAQGTRAPRPAPKPQAPKPVALKPVAPALAKVSVQTMVLNTPPKPPTGPVIVPPGVKRTVAPPIPDRFAVDPASVRSTFGRIGEYESTGSALERAYGGA